MKRTGIVILAILVAAALVPQALEAGVGIKGGFSLSKWQITTSEVEPLVPFGNLPFFTGGLFFSVGFGPIAIQPEILYVRMGTKLEELGNRLEFRLDYLQAPVLLKLRIIPVGPIRPFIYVGGYGSYLLQAKGVMVAGDLTEEADITENYERVDYGAVGGAGLAFHLPGITLSVEGRYNLGLANIIKDAAPGEATKNRSMMALAGISF